MFSRLSPPITRIIWEIGVAKFGNTKYNKFSLAKFGGDSISKCTCFFIGHRDAPDNLSPELAALVERHIVEYGVREFTVGQYGRFDRMAARTVQEAKQRHPDVRLVYLLPYHPAERPIETPKGFDRSLYPFVAEKVPKPFAIVRANRYMVDNSDFLIAYAQHPGNARELVEYAQRREKRGLIRVSVLPAPHAASSSRRASASVSAEKRKSPP